MRRWLWGAMVALTVGAFTAAPTEASAQASCGTVATAAPRLVANPTSLPPTGTSTVAVVGSRYLVPPHACGSSVFGGVYLFFGWAAPGGQWGPGHRNSTSMNGHFGHTYHYPGNGGGAETRDDGTGTMRLIAFTAGGLSAGETDVHMDRAGNWATTLKVHGPTYAWTDPAGARHTVDCRKVQCGVFTIGAHGKGSATNERFAPVTFASAPSGGGSTGSNGGSSAQSGGSASGGLQAPGVGNSGASAAQAPSVRSGGGSGGSATASNPAGGTGATSPTSSTPAAVGDATTVPGSSSAPTSTARQTTTTVEDPDRIAAASERAGGQVFDDDNGGNGGSAGLVAAGTGALAVVAGGGWFALRRRKFASTTPESHDA